MNTALPPSANVSEQLHDGRLMSPSAARNVTALGNVLRTIAPARGRALEIASGTGQHCVAFAKACPSLMWVPTDIAPERLASIAIYVSEAQLDNLTLPVALDAAQSGWSKTTGPLDLIVVSNLLHLISGADARTVISEAAKALAPGGVILLYGPFKRAGVLTSEGDKRFHQDLSDADPDIGYKNDGDVIDWAHSNGLKNSQVIEMPANNLSLVFHKPE